MSPKILKLLADGIFVIHIAVIAALIGGILGIVTGFLKPYPKLLRLHSMLGVLTTISQIIFLGCPLTAIEYCLRNQYNPNIRFHGSLVVDLILRFTGIQLPQITITVGLYLLVAISIIAWYTWRPRREGHVIAWEEVKKRRQV